MRKTFAKVFLWGSSPTRRTKQHNPAHTDKKRIKPFSIRWNEPLGLPECPYMRRWVFNFKLFSIRIHQWYRSDDKRYMHDHAFNFTTIVLKGGYTDVYKNEENETKIDVMTLGSVRYRKAKHVHYVHEPKHGTITLLFCGPKVRNWGFYVKSKFIRPLKFFHKYGHPPCNER